MRKLFLLVVLLFMGSPVFAQVYVGGGAHFGMQGCGGPKIPRAIREIERDQKEISKNIKTADRILRDVERDLDDARRTFQEHERALNSHFRTGDILTGVKGALQSPAVVGLESCGNREAGNDPAALAKTDLAQGLEGYRPPWTNFCVAGPRRATAAEVADPNRVRNRDLTPDEARVQPGYKAGDVYVYDYSADAHAWSKHIVDGKLSATICDEPTFKRGYVTNTTASAPTTTRATNVRLNPKLAELDRLSNSSSSTGSSATGDECKDALANWAIAKAEYEGQRESVAIARKELDRYERDHERKADKKEYEAEKWYDDMMTRGPEGGICYTCMYGQEAEVSTVSKVAGILGVLGGAAIGLAGARQAHRTNTEMGWPTNPLIYYGAAAPLVMGGIYGAMSGGLSGGFGCGAGMAGGLGGGAGGGAFGYPSGMYGPLGGGMFGPGMAYSGYMQGFPGYIVGGIGGLGMMSGGFPAMGMMAPMSGMMGPIGGGFPAMGMIGGAGGIVGMMAPMSGMMGPIGGGFPAMGMIGGAGGIVGMMAPMSGMMGPIGGGFPAMGMIGGVGMMTGMMAPMSGMMGPIGGGFPAMGMIGGVGMMTGMMAPMSAGYPAMGMIGGMGMMAPMGGSMAAMQYQMQMMQMYQSQMTAWMQEQQRMQQDYQQRTQIVGRLQEELYRIQMQIQQISTGAYGGVGFGGGVGIGIGGGGGYPTGIITNPVGTDPNLNPNGPARGRGYQ